MKNLFDIVQENPTNFEKKEIEDLAEGFIKEYDADITPKDKVKLRKELKTEVKMEGDEILYQRRREWIEEYYINSPPITTIRRLIAAETDNGAKVMNDLADDLVN